MRLRTTVPGLLWLLAASGRLPAGEPADLFRHGGRWAAVGDSITHAGAYHSYVHLFLLTRQAGDLPEVHNCGVSGDTAPGTLGRYDDDLAPVRPTVATVMLGMNDLARQYYMPTGPVDDAARARAREVYRESLTALVRRLTTDGARVIVVTPSLYDETAQQAGLKPAIGAEAELEAGAAIARAIADEQHLPFVDLLGPMRELTRAQQRTLPAFSLISPDRVHPSLEGHFVIAVELLRQLHFRPVVATIAVPAGEGSPAAEHCTVSHVRRTAAGLEFDCLEDALPYPVAPELEATARLVGFDDLLNRELLVVRGLPAGDYAVRIDGQPVTRVAAAQLESGFNLATCRETPQYAQARRVAAAEQKRFELGCQLRILPQWRQFMIANHIPPDGGDDSARQVDALLEKWRKAGAPYVDIMAQLAANFKDVRAHQVELRRQMSEWLDRAQAEAPPRPHHYELARLPAS